MRRHAQSSMPSQSSQSTLEARAKQHARSQCFMSARHTQSTFMPTSTYEIMRPRGMSGVITDILALVLLGK